MSKLSDTLNSLTAPAPAAEDLDEKKAERAEKVEQAQQIVEAVLDAQFSENKAALLLAAIAKGQRDELGFRYLGRALVAFANRRKINGISVFGLVDDKPAKTTKTAKKAVKKTKK